MVDKSGIAARRVANPSSTKMEQKNSAKAAKAKLLAFCDADDVPEVSWLAALVAASGGNAVVGGRLEKERLNSSLGRTFQQGPQTSSLSSAMGFLPFSSTANLLVPACAHHEIGGFDERLLTGQDIEYSWRLQLAGYSLRFCSEAVVHYRLRENRGAELRKLFRYAMQDPLLYKMYAFRGARRRSALGVLRSWSMLLLGAPLCVSPNYRERWLRQVFKNAGWILGSVRHRVVYL